MKKKQKPEFERPVIRLVVEPEGFWAFVFVCLRAMGIAILVAIVFWIAMLMLLGLLARWFG